MIWCPPLFWWTPHASEHSTAKGAAKFALTDLGWASQFHIGIRADVPDASNIICRLNQAIRNASAAGALGDMATRYVPDDRPRYQANAWSPGIDRRDDR